MSDNNTAPASPPANSNAVFIDARAAGYEGEPIRMMAVTLVNSGKIVVRRLADWQEQTASKDNTVVVTDTPSAFHHWGLAFKEKDDMHAVIAAYKAVSSAKLLQIDDAIRAYDPSFVIQTRKVDERGQVLEFDSMSLNNGHVAVLLAVWAARMSHGGYMVTRISYDGQSEDDDGDMDDGGMLPFSV